jgi:hypothetical protein
MAALPSFDGKAHGAMVLTPLAGLEAERTTGTVYLAGYGVECI